MDQKCMVNKYRIDHLEEDSKDIKDTIRSIDSKIDEMKKHFNIAKWIAIGSISLFGGVECKELVLKVLFGG